MTPLLWDTPCSSRTFVNMTQYTHTGLLSNYRMTLILCFLAFILAIEFLTLNLVENIIV